MHGETLNFDPVISGYISISLHLRLGCLKLYLQVRMTSLTVLLFGIPAFYHYNKKGARQHT